MSRQALMITAVLAVVLAGLTPSARAEITAIAGFTQAEVTEYRSGAEGDTDRATESFPGTAAVLPLQVVARLASVVTGEEAAAAVAAQFADPTELSQANPEEFAINLALNSISPDIRYEAQAVSRETRDVLFSAGELGLFSATGDTEELIGRLYLDGAMTIMAVDPDADLTGAFVRLRVTVVRSVAGEADQTVFTGTLELSGATGGNATVVAEGSFPTDDLVLTDLSLISDDFAAFAVLIIPSITIEYTYTAIVGQPLTLQATVEVEAANVADETGVAAIIGAPTDTLAEVIGLTQGELVAGKTLTALENERGSPSGAPAFPQAQPALLPLCGIMGFESLLGVVGLIGLKRFGVFHRCTRK